MPTKKAPARKVTKPAVKKPVKKVLKKDKKVLSKKAPTKKSPAMKKPVKDLVYASDQESFWTQDGEILNSLKALLDAFTKMEKEVFVYHAQGGQNDFALWVEGVLCDSDCAADLKKAKTVKGAKTVVAKHLKSYSI